MDIGTFTRYGSELVDQLEELLTSLEDAAEIDRVALVYGLGQASVMPPTVGVLYREDRDEDTEDGDEVEGNWNPAEFEHYGDEDLGLERTPGAQAVDVQLAEEDDPAEEALRRMLDRVCIELTGRMRHKHGSDRFFAYATDDDMADARAHVDAVREQFPDVDAVMPSWF